MSDVNKWFGGTCRSCGHWIEQKIVVHDEEQEGKKRIRCSRCQTTNMCERVEHTGESLNL